MSGMIALLRGVNVSGTNLIKMDALRKLCGTLGLRDVQTYIQSGNIVFRQPEPRQSESQLAIVLEDAIEREFGFRPRVMLRSTEDLRRLVTANPLPHHAKAEPGKLLVTFLDDDPGEAARDRIRAIKFDPEEVGIEGREIFVYYPTGQGRSKLRWGPIEKAVGPGTARNWNTVLKLLEMSHESI